jgi:UDP-N-acetylmuramoyl-tripeptide--D-alanyl-D-alanine ligase
MRARGSPLSAKVSGWSVDTRTQAAGDVYFALRGSAHDGHDFVRASIEKRAAAVVVERECGAEIELVVSDSLRALQELGAWAREQWGGIVVGVTGSAGKTTTKDAIAHLLAAAISVGKTEGNFNNHVGVPLSILRLPEECRAAVLEMGMNHAGEIRALAAIAKPQIGVVTNVGYAHLEFFDSIGGIAAAKRELIEALPKDGVAVLNADDERVARFREVHPGRTVTFGFGEAADVRGEMRLGSRGQAGGLSYFRALGVDYETGLTGRHGVANLLAAIAVASEFGIAPECLREPVRTFAVGKMRGERIERDGLVIWNDCYNSNPEAARSMIDVLRDTPAARRIAVLGEMLELGEASESLHRELGEYSKAQGIDLVIAVHGAAKALAQAAGGEFFETPEAAGDYLRSIARAGDAVLIKGSRGVHTERALEKLVA